MHGIVPAGFGHQVCHGGPIAAVLVPEIMRCGLPRPGIRIKAPADRREARCRSAGLRPRAGRMI